MAKTHASRFAVAGGLALALTGFSTTAFIAPRSATAPGGAALRGCAIAVEPFRAQSPQAVEPERPLSWASLASLMATLGLMAGVATTPVRAEEAPAAEAAPTAALAAAPAPSAVEQATISTFETGGSFAKGGRKKAKSDAVKAKKVKEAAVSIKNGPGVKVVQEEDGSKKKVVISPADERDEDELSSRERTARSSRCWPSHRPASSSSSGPWARSRSSEWIWLMPAAMEPVTTSVARDGRWKPQFDCHELSLSRTNRPLLALLAIAPSSIFIVFWTL
eukprot:CAMPEP_0115289892 /NCGR_PEP_ID=MMETSP0270-20121206/63751_1 /TAXON_ID=71861 /ORGANISM="Scrippsiella trochoidea, Strain CCMP3099" /LENGTH=276 /DNA_ID=CAMNT_0002707101 /DNA_START=4 /DNA_END=831 /DNA_ORIENTATION=+